MTAWMIYPLAATGKISASVDWLFHSARVEQIYDNLRQGCKFTFIATTTFQHTGVGSFLFYPDGSLYIWALLRFIFSPVKAYYAWVGIFLFLTFVISYWCMLKFSNDKLRSFIFALLYGLAPYHLYLSPVNWVIGEFTAYTFIPIVFLGIYEVLRRNEKEWPLLAVGVALLMLSHLLSVALCAEIFVVLLLITLFKEKKLSLSRWMGLVKAGILALGLSLPIFVLLFSEYFHKGVEGPYSGVYIVQNLSSLFTDSMNNFATWSSIGLILLVIALTGWKWVSHENCEFTLYVMMIGILLLSTAIFPWKSFNHTPFAIIQLPCRYLTYAILFGAVLGSRGIATLLLKLPQGSEKLAVIAIVPLMLLGYFGAIAPLTNSLENSASNILCKLNPGQHQILNNKILNNQNYKDQFAYWAFTGEVDYYSTKSKTLGMRPGTPTWDAITKNPRVDSIVENTLFVNGKNHRYRVAYKPNRFDFDVTLSKPATVDFPVVKYAGTNAIDNGKKVKVDLSQRGTAQLKLAAGENHVEIGFKPPFFYYISIVIMLISWIGTLFLGCRRKIKR